ncbi:hypothetical protein BDN72DRAFT_761686 [Pluteus cervinus]|uniref:Uncharacterized protein n=1 Tax=Pluteus cervinus TaxID=181527 RepID=A0ACD3B6I0_9AGAR|nr:hypothetical protein BDN72DRAFT_761686 [Pluteus cervinus]
MAACSQAQRVLQKQQQRTQRAPLAIKSDINGATTTATVAPTQQPAAPITLRLPRTLPRPAFREINVAAVTATYPELKGVVPQYIRDRLPVAGARMLAAAASVQVSHPKNALPKELEIVMNDMVAAACPTHMFAIHGPTASTSTAGGAPKRKVTLFPVHHIVFAAHCSNLPTMPVSAPHGDKTRTLPVVPLCLPSPDAFPLLQTYLYQKQPQALLASLVPASLDVSDALRLGHQAMVIHGLWRNACALGVVDSQLFDVIDRAWEVILVALQRAHL